MFKKYVFLGLYFVVYVHCGFVAWMFGKEGNFRSNLEDFSVASSKHAKQHPDPEMNQHNQNHHVNEKQLKTSKLKAPLSVQKADIPFEMKTTDEKFLVQAGVHELSQLDACHHRVVLQIQGTCSEMSEEELAKTAVLLLNCQSKSEGRKIFPCTKEMMIKECTQDMDATTWNAYQIVSNRVRAICYTARQQQFRMKAEHTVNKLVNTAQSQLEIMKYLEEGQSKINTATSETLSKMAAGQQDMIKKHEVLKASQENVQTYIANNLRELTREKALISAGHKELADMTENIKKKLDAATEKLHKQGEDQKDNHQEVAKDLLAIRERAQEVWKKIDDSSNHVLQFHNETTENYKTTLENLRKVNATINFVIKTIDQMNESVEKKLNWVSNLIGGTDVNVKLLSVSLVHVGYFLLAVLSAAVFSTPAFSRMVLLMLIPVNALMEIKHSQGLGFMPVTAFIGFTVIANWAVAWTWYLLFHKRISEQAQNALPGQSPSKWSPTGSKWGSISEPDVKRLINLLETVCKKVTPYKNRERCNESPSSSFLESIQTPAVVVRTPMPGLIQDEEACDDLPNVRMGKVEQVRRHLMDTLDDPRESRCSTPAKPGSRPPSRSTTPDRRSRPSTPNRSINRPLCCGTTKTGAPCKLPSSEDSNFCFKHK